MRSSSSGRKSYELNDVRPHLHTVGFAVLLALVLWTGFPLVLLTGSMMWEKLRTPTAALRARGWLLKLVGIPIVGRWL